MRQNAKNTLHSWLLALAFTFTLLHTSTHAERSYIHIVGSSTIYPMITAAAEIYSTETHHVAPIIESTGTGGGIKVFCNGIGDAYPDLVVTSRPMSLEEIKFCKLNGIQKLERFVIGYDGIVIAQSTPHQIKNINISDLFDALEKHREVDQKKVKNPISYWNEIDPAYRHQKIKILGPPSTSGTKQTFLQLVFNSQLIQEKHYPYTPELRDDLTYIDTAEQETVTATKLHLEQDAIAIFSYGFLIKNRDKIHAIPVNHILPTFETITDGTYPLSRSLYIYVKGENLKTTTDLSDFMRFFFSETISGLRGYLKNYGLIPLPSVKFLEEREKLLSFLTDDVRG